MKRKGDATVRIGKCIRGHGRGFRALRRANRAEIEMLALAPVTNRALWPDEVIACKAIRSSLIQRYGCLWSRACRGWSGRGRRLRRGREREPKRGTQGTQEANALFHRGSRRRHSGVHGYKTTPKCAVGERDRKS